MVSSLARSSVPFCTKDFLAAKAAKLEAKAAKMGRAQPRQKDQSNKQAVSVQQCVLLEGGGSTVGEPQQ